MDSCLSRSQKRPGESLDDNYPSHTIEVSWPARGRLASCWLAYRVGIVGACTSSVRVRGTLVIVRSPGPLNKIRATGRAVCQSARGCCLSVTLTWEDAAWFHPRSSAPLPKASYDCCRETRSHASARYPPPPSRASVPSTSQRAIS